MKLFLRWIIKLTASEVIYVSDYLAKKENLPNIVTHVIHNAIEDEFMKVAKSHKHKSNPEKNVLMICSLKVYKGVNEFIALANTKPTYNFKLVVNASLLEIESYFKGHSLPENLIVYPTQKNTHPFYQWADVVLNLSRPEEWIETFGLTVIEAMCYGLPVIVPPVGGIIELVDESFNGYRIDGKDTAYLSYKLREILENQSNYIDMRKAALYKIGYFNESRFISKSLAVINPKKDEVLVEFMEI